MGCALGKDGADAHSAHDSGAPLSVQAPRIGLRSIGYLAMLLTAQGATAGTLQFQVVMAPTSICLTNSGSDTAYHVTPWSLDSRSHWVRLPAPSNDGDSLEPWRRRCFQRDSAPPTTPLGRQDPVLIQLRDQAGGTMAHLAWGHPPPPEAAGLRTGRIGPRLEIMPPEPSVGILATQVIAVPYAGIAALASPLRSMEPPRDPILHDWHAGQTLTLDTGAGHGGAWLVHRHRDGHLAMQIVPDGVVRGREQIPSWLTWLKRHASLLAGLLFLTGSAILLAGLRRSMARS